jgi:hypothetical protein
MIVVTPNFGNERVVSGTRNGPNGTACHRFELATLMQANGIGRCVGSAGSEKVSGIDSTRTHLKRHYAGAWVRNYGRAPKLTTKSIRINATTWR